MRQEILFLRVQVQEMIAQRVQGMILYMRQQKHYITCSQFTLVEGIQVHKRGLVIEGGQDLLGEHVLVAAKVAVLYSGWVTLTLTRKQAGCRR